MKELFASLETLFNSISEHELKLNRSVGIRIRLLRKQLSFLRHLIQPSGRSG